MNYVVIDLRNEHYGVGARSSKEKVDYVLHLGGMTLDAARNYADKLNCKKPEDKTSDE